MMIKPTSGAFPCQYYSSPPRRPITSGDLPDFVFEAMEKVIDVYRKSADP